MSDSLDALVLDLLAWIGPDPRPYTEVVDAWRTSCPRLPVWEEANDRGLVTRLWRDGASVVVLTPRGHALLGAQRAKVEAA